VPNPRVQNVRNPNGLMGVQGNGNQNQIGNGNLVAAPRPRRRDGAYLQTQLLIAQKEEAGIQLQAKEYDLMAAAADLDDIEEVNANCILMANLQQASTSCTQSDSTSVYDTDGSAEVHKNYDDNEIFNMFTQEEQYTELLEPIPKLHQVPQNDNDVVSEVTGVEQGGEIEEQHTVNFEETRALYDSLYQNLAIEVEKVNSVNRNPAGYNDVIGNQNQIRNGNLMAARAKGNATGQNGNQIRCYNCRGIGHYARNCTARPKRRDAAYLQTQLLIAQKEEAGIQLQAEEYDLMAAAADLDDIEEVNANCILMANLQQAST
nr:hypothetical protein [Tanacetum cinerariifolium]